MSQAEMVKTDKQAEDLRAKALDQAEAATRTALALAETLFAIKYSVVKAGGKETPLVQVWGHDDFHEYAEHELGMHGSTAEGYVHVHDVLILGEGLKVADLPKSITKLLQLARIAKKTGQSTKAWLKKAAEMSCCEFQEAVEEELTGRPSHRAWSFYLANKDLKTIERGLKRAKELLGTTHNGETLARIVDEWSGVAETTSRLRPVKRAS